jgi:hypothetical protein
MHQDCQLQQQEVGVRQPQSCHLYNCTLTCNPLKLGPVTALHVQHFHVLAFSRPMLCMYTPRRTAYETCTEKS